MTPAHVPAASQGGVRGRSFACRLNLEDLGAEGKVGGEPRPANRPPRLRLASSSLLSMPSSLPICFRGFMSALWASSRLPANPFLLK